MKASIFGAINSWALEGFLAPALQGSDFHLAK